MDSTLEDEDQEDAREDLDMQSENSQEVIGLLLTQSDEGDENVDNLADKSSTPEPQGDMDGHQPLSIATVTLADGQQQIVLHSTQVIQMQDGTTAIIPSEDALHNAKFIDGQTIQLEDGSTAFLSTCKDLKLEDSQMPVAYIASSRDSGGVFSDSGLEFYAEPSEVVGDKVKRSESLKPISPRALALGDKAYRCLYEGCDRLYTTQHHLKVHERSHTGDRPFRCEHPDCNKAFATGYGLKSHVRVHTGEKPYKCPDESCDKAFKTSGDLQKHIRTHTGEKPFKCTFPGCDRSFTTSNIKKVHVRTHTGEKPYRCEEQGCGRAFASATNYKNHIRIHTGEKPYVCTSPGCGKRFTEYSSLYKHHVVHTHAKPYSCTICNKTYRQTSTLAMHRRTVHGLNEGLEEMNPGTGSAEEEDEDGEPLSKIQKLELTSTNNFVIRGDQQIMLANAMVPVSIHDSIGAATNVSPLSGLTLGLTGNNQIVVVADPSQILALQQLAAQQQLQQQQEQEQQEQIEVSIGLAAESPGAAELGDEEERNQIGENEDRQSPDSYVIST